MNDARAVHDEPRHLFSSHAAGIIEGLVSLSNIDFTQRILVLVGTVTFWLLYLGPAGRSQRPSLTHSDRVEPT